MAGTKRSDDPPGPVDHVHHRIHVEAQFGHVSHPTGTEELNISTDHHIDVANPDPEKVEHAITDFEPGSDG